jgi:hypothetical protein
MNLNLLINEDIIIIITFIFIKLLNKNEHEKIS